MRQGFPDWRTSFTGPIARSIVVAVLGTTGLLLIMLWTAYTVRKHIMMASLSVFPAALEIQRAGTAFERMNREYRDAVLIQEIAGVQKADREAATVTSSLDNAAAFMMFNPNRHQQILALRSDVDGLRRHSKSLYGEIVVGSSLPPRQEELTALTRENGTLQKTLDTLQGSLTNDFRDELSLINKLVQFQAILESLVFIGVLIALFFSIRSVIHLTVRKREDELLHQAHSSQEKERNMLRALIDNIPDFMYVKDVNSKFVVANSFLAHAVGAKSPDELLGKNDYEFFPPEMARAFYEDEQEVLRIGVPLYNREEKCIDHHGNVTDIITTKVPLRDDQGRIIGVAGVGRDISERKQMEDALREAELKYRGIFDKAIVGIFQSSPEGRFLSVNPSMAFTLGYDSPEEMIASISDLSTQFYSDPKRRDEFRLFMEKMGGVQNFSCEVYRKDGSTITISMSVRAIRENGVVVRYDGMCEDITERNLLREQLLQAQKLESVGQLAAGIAHEINTPIQYIGDNVRFIKDSFKNIGDLLTQYEALYQEAQNSTLTSKTIEETGAAVEEADVSYLMEEIPRAIDQTLEGVTRVSTLVSAMKEFSHPGTKEKIPLDLNHAIDSTITVARNEWKYVADMETDFDPSLPLISCLPGEFNQVILNLIVNSAHAIADVVQKDGQTRGKIKVQTRDCSDWVEIRIQDSGTGIPQNVRSRIFDPFFTTKDIGKGTGQGLAIARSVIVDKHGGSIKFETEEGQGTTFIVRLPHTGKTLTTKAVA
jgi:PAS domain S-box-containing protein